MFCVRKVKYQYSKEVDSNTIYFHSLVKRNNRRREIVVIEKKGGGSTTNIGEIVAEFMKTFQAQLGNNTSRSPLQTSYLLFGNFLSLEQQKPLIRVPIKDEIKKPSLEVEIKKALGPNKYRFKFFKQIWDTIKIDFLAVVLEFFRNEKLLKQWNHTLTSLVPKSTHASKVTYYRSISVCSVFYKVISKLLATKLADIADHIYHSTQIAFVKSKSIIDNIHLSQELMRTIHKKESPHDVHSK